jgi:hypothetical protein
MPAIYLDIVEVKFTLEPAMKSHTGSKGTTLPYNVGAGLGSMDNDSLRSLYARE